MTRNKNIDHPMKDVYSMFPYMRVDICRAFEISKIADFDFVLIDLTDNNFYANFFTIDRNLRSPEVRQLQFVVDKPQKHYLLNGKNRENWEEAYARWRTHNSIYRENCRHFSELYNTLHDESPPGFDMLVKAFRVYDATFIEMINTLMLTEAIMISCGDNSLLTNHVSEAITYGIVRDDPNGLPNEVGLPI